MAGRAGLKHGRKKDKGRVIDQISWRCLQVFLGSSSDGEEDQRQSSQLIRIYQAPMQGGLLLLVEPLHRAFALWVIAGGHTDFDTQKRS